MPHPLTPPTAAQVSDQLFKLFDTHHDQSITLDEVKDVLSAHVHAPALDLHALRNAFSALDANHDGALSVGEVTSAAAGVLDHLHGAAGALLAVATPQQLLALLGAAAHHEGWTV